MIIKKLYFSNFRRFDTLEIDFHNKLTVIVARNGHGKTTVLDAVTIALGTFVGAFDLGAAKHMSTNDARYVRHQKRLESEQQYPVTIKACFSVQKVSDYNIIRELTSKKSRTTTKNATVLTNYGKSLMQKVRDLQDEMLPIVAYYGSGRLWNAHKNMSRKSVLSESRSMGYEDCLSPASNFKQVQQWMAKATYAVMQQQEMREYEDNKLPEQVEGIKAAVNSVLKYDGWKNFHYSLSYEELTMYHDDLGILPVSLLSDGVRAMVSLTADLAWRCAKLNPHLGMNAPAETPGIVLIDEVDIHLHPAWQQRVINSLQTIFKNIQFIVTTHSPQVLSTVPSESIRLLKYDTDMVAMKPSIQSRGVTSADVMASLMDTDPIPDVAEANWLSEYKSLIQQNIYETEQAKELRQKLNKHFGEQHQEIFECERLIRLTKIKGKLKQQKN
jgi:predicted ATP-binding protein involved in virulence